MTRLNAVLLLFCVLAACMLPAQAATMPYGSFLTRPISDGDDLAQLLRRDKVVARRFANHYGMSNDAIADYIEKYGQVVTLSQSKNYVEYFIESSGRVRKHHKLLRPGTRILVVKGTPVLDMRCGNPMNKTLPKIVERVQPMVQETPPPPAPAPVQPQALETPPLVQVLEQPVAPPPPAPEPLVQVLSEKPMEYPAIASSPGITELAWLLPGLVGLSTLGGGSSNAVVPEPTGLMVLGFGAAGFVLTCSRRLRNR